MGGFRGEEVHRVRRHGDNVDRLRRKIDAIFHLGHAIFVFFDHLVGIFLQTGGFAHHGGDVFPAFVAVVNHHHRHVRGELVVKIKCLVTANGRHDHQVRVLCEDGFNIGLKLPHGLNASFFGFVCPLDSKSLILGEHGGFAIPATAGHNGSVNGEQRSGEGH